jgi:hypothetical protein
LKILIIDSHKGSQQTIPQNLHWQNSKILSDYLQADLIWSYPEVNNNIKSNYDAIIFTHASHYSYTDYEWLERSPNAKLYYITNEYNLGEPRTLWMAVKKGRKYEVIANHPHEISKVVMKYVDNWHILNLNSLVYDPKQKDTELNFLDSERKGCIYYGSFRKDRAKYFLKYLDKNITLSTHSKNLEKFLYVGVTSNIINRINWSKEGLFLYKQSLYIEDEKTHIYYNYLANRFYEALNYNCTPIFSTECKHTVELSGYTVSDDFYIEDSSQLKEKEILTIPEEWYILARKEKEKALLQIAEIVTGGI